jgi:hypothetical protein
LGAIAAIGFSVATAVTGLVKAYFALGAKYRAHELFKDDARLRETILTAAQGGHLREAIKEIESTTSSLSKKDREYLKEGLHQHSVAGTKNFVREVVGSGQGSSGG